MMIKPPQRLRDILEEKIGAIHGYKHLANAQFLFFHLAILSFSLVNWEEYVSAQRIKLETYVCNFLELSLHAHSTALYQSSLVFFVFSPPLFFSLLFASYLFSVYSVCI